MKVFFLILPLFFSVYSCNKQQKENTVFKFPKVEINYKNYHLIKDSLTTINTDSLTNQFSGYVFGKYQKNISKIKVEEFELTECLNDENNYDTIQFDGLQIKVDASQIIIDPFYFNMSNNRTSFNPVVILNETSETKGVTLISNRILLIQEIYLEKHHLWYAINQPLVAGMCGQNHTNITLKQDEYILVNAPVYEGNDYARMRVRIKSGDNVYISNQYYSKINLSQIYLTRELKELFKRYSRNGGMGERFCR